MSDPKTPQEPRRVSQPGQTPGQEPNEIPGGTPPVEAPSTPQTEYEKHVPHSPNQPVAHTGKSGEGSYEGTRKYAEGYDEFARTTTPDTAVAKAKKIDPDDPSLRKAEERAKHAAERTSSSSIH